MKVKTHTKMGDYEPENKFLVMDFDDMGYIAYNGTKYDTEMRGHSATIKAGDKEAFLDALAAYYRVEFEKMLRPKEEDE